MQARRALIVGASAEQAQQLADEQAQAEQARSARQSELDARLATLERALAALGGGDDRGRASSHASANPSGRPLGFLLAQALARQDVRLLGLRELTVDVVQQAVTAPAEGVPATAADDAAIAPPAAAAAPIALYRHRFEVTLGGNPAALIDALRAIDQGARPLRVERAHLSGADADSVRLAITLAVVTTERSWLSI